MPKIERMRDPVHDLIVFSDHGVDAVAWELINSIEFQRLRRIRQLGFSEFVYPSATHTRFSHSIGVFHNARRLLAKIRDKIGTDKFDDGRAFIAALAALLHDLGHGPFSHTFDHVDRRLRQVRKRHENWSAEIIEGDTGVGKILRRVDGKLPSEIAKILVAEEPADIYAAIVSSQFDADRLDYLVRDRYMTGVEIGRFDINWLIDCLEIADIIIASNTDKDIDQHNYSKVPGFVLSEKGYTAAEGYLEARFHLYSNVYLHKTTRSAEQMLGALLRLVGAHVKATGLGASELPVEHPLLQYIVAEKPTVAQYMALDDMSVWSLLPILQTYGIPQIAAFANGIMQRKLFKCVDIGARLPETGGDENVRFRMRLTEHLKDGKIEPFTVLTDEPRVTGYDWYSWGDESALKKVLIHDREQNKNFDIGERSDIVKALRQRQFYRVYIPDREWRDKIEGLWAEISK